MVGDRGSAFVGVGETGQASVGVGEAAQVGTFVAGEIEASRLASIRSP